MARNKNGRESDPADSKFKLASKYVIGMLLLLEELMTDKNTDNQ